MNTDYLAIDLVLLPPEKIIEDIIEFNHQIIAKSTENLVLGNNSCIPHISIRMGVIRKKNVPNIIKAYKKLPLPESLRITKLSKTEKENGNYRFLLNIENNTSLLDFHEKAMNIPGFASPKIKPLYFHNPPLIEPKTIEYVSNFNQYARDNFQPHITLGLGYEIIPFPAVEFKPKKAIFHLSNQCACSVALYRE